jgi:hypothetical protein
MWERGVSRDNYEAMGQASWPPVSLDEYHHRLARLGPSVRDSWAAQCVQCSHALPAALDYFALS